MANDPVTDDQAAKAAAKADADAAKEAAKADAEARSEASEVEADHKAGKGLRTGWSYSPTRDPRYMRTADAKKRRLQLQGANQLPNGTPDRLLEAGFKEKPDQTKKRR